MNKFLVPKVTYFTIIDEHEESIANIYQHLSNSLLRMADCSKNVAAKAKN